ncbi:unnamed protein product [Boreogadus saida]
MPSIPRDEELGPHTRHRYSNVFPSLTAGRVLVVTLVDKELLAAGLRPLDIESLHMVLRNLASNLFSQGDT